jgi:uncharacterized protein
MKRLLLLLSAFVLLLGGVAHADHPAPTGFVVDAADVLTAPVEAKIEAELRDYSRRTTNQVAVAIVQSLDGESVEDYARELFNEWGVGTKAKNNGVLLLIALDDRADRIQIGYGLESVLTDEVAQGVLDNAVMPYAADDNWPSAALAGERAIRVALHDPRAKAPVVPGQDTATSPFGGGQAQDAPVVDAPPDGSLDVPFDNQPGSAIERGSDSGFPIVPVVVGVGIVGALALAGASRGRRGGRGLSFTGVAAGAILYEEQRHHTSSSSDSSSFGGFSAGSDSSGGGSSGSFGGGSSGDGGASGSF